MVDETGVRNMMGNYLGRYGDGSWGMMGGYGPGLYSAFHIITWFLVICVLAALLRWLWKKGG